MSWKQNEFDRDFFLTHTGSVWECKLCRCSAFDREDITHENDCVFADATVTGVRLVVTPERRSDICGNCTMAENECPAEIGLGGSLVTHDRAMKICSIYKKAVDYVVD